VSAARARSPASPDFSSSAAINSISCRPRFCDSFQRVSIRATGIEKLTMPSSIMSTYFWLRASCFGNQAGSRLSISRRWDSAFAFLSEMIAGTP